jgi:hypothetical protein
MPKELFNQPLISSPSEPDDNDRLALSVPGATGGKNILWSYLKTIIQNIASLFDFIDFTPQNPAPAEREARMYYNDTNKAYEAYTEIAGVPPMRIGRTLRSRVLNQTGSLIPKGSIVKIAGLSGASPIVELSQANQLDDVRKTIGMTLADIPNNTHGYLAVFDTIIGVNTSGASPNDLVYLDPDVAGGFTTTEPEPPDYTLPVGFVSVVDPINGVIGVRFGGFEGNDTSTNSQGAINGIATHSPNIEFSVSGGVIYADLTNEEHPTKDLPFLLSDMRYLMNTTTNTGPGGAARVVIPPGASSTEKQTSVLYIYLNGSVPTFAVTTSSPTVPHVKIADVAVFDAARTLADGERPLSYRRHNNAIDSQAEGQPGGFGIFRYFADAFRFKLGSNWLSGQDATPTVNDTTIRVSLSAGEGAQLHRANLPLFDGLKYLIYNNATNTPTYEEVDNLTAITSTALGVSLLTNNTYYTIRLYYQLNSNGIGNNVIATRPLGKYSTAAEAILDGQNFTTVLNDPDIEETVYPVYDIVIGRTGSGGTTITLQQLTDLRSKLAGGSGGGGAGGAGTDDKVRVSAADTTNDYLNNKATAVNGITPEILNPGANEQLRYKLGGAMIEKTVLSGLFDFCVSQGKMIVGKESADSLMTVYENTANTNKTAGLTIEQAGTGDAVLQFLITGIKRWVIGIDNDDSDSFKIAVNEDLGLTTAMTIDILGAATFSSTVTATNFILSSDKRLKDEIKPVQNKGVNEIELKQFVFKDDKDKRLRFGVLAQDLEKIYPEMVYIDQDGFKRVGYNDFLIAKAAATDERIKNLENEVKELKDIINKLIGE